MDNSTAAGVVNNTIVPRASGGYVAMHHRISFDTTGMLDPKTGPTTTQNITLTPTMKRIESHMQVMGLGWRERILQKIAKNAKTRSWKMAPAPKLLKPEAEKLLKKQK
jgi:hypothetical protein